MHYLRDIAASMMRTRVHTGAVNIRDLSSYLVLNVICKICSGILTVFPISSMDTLAQVNRYHFQIWRLTQLSQYKEVSINP